MITESKIDEALTWLNDSIESMAMSKGKMELLENQTKNVKACLMLESKLPSNAAQETYALASEEYMHHLSKVADAFEEYERYKLRKDYCMALIDTYRTQESSRRIFERGVR